MGRSLSLDVLDRLQVASPCPVRWDDMQGDDRKRFCGQCRLHVYNLSAMTREEAVTLVTTAEGRVCAGFWRRADGTVLTRDCPVGLAAARAKAAAALRRIAAAAALLVGSGLVFGSGKAGGWRLRQIQPFATVCNWLGAPKQPPARWFAGDIGVRPASQPRPGAGSGAVQ